MHGIHWPRRFRRQWWVIFATLLLALILAGVTGAIVTNLQAQGQPKYQSAVGTPVFQPTKTPATVAPPQDSAIALPPPFPISGPPSKASPPRLPAETGVIFTDKDGIYLLTSASAGPEKLDTPGYSPLISPVLTSDGHLLYAGDGLYLIDLLHRERAPLQIASIDKATQVIASATISPDSKEVFWSVEPHAGNGMIMLYKSTLTETSANTITINAPTLLYSQPAGICPCYMIFGLGPAEADGSFTLLLTDDLGTPAGQGTGLWLFDQAHQQVGPELLAADQGETPLALSPDRTRLAYAPTTGEVPEPTDSSVPSQIATQPYGNSLAVTGWGSSGSGHLVTIVPQQTNVHTFSSYHWITTPIFSPDSQILAYIQFSSDDYGPYDRHSTLYVSSTGGKNAPTVVAVFSARLVELGDWLDDHTILLYADGGIYALDIHTAAIALLAPTHSYSHIVGVVHLPGTTLHDGLCSPHCIQPQGTPHTATTSERMLLPETPTASLAPRPTPAQPRLYQWLVVPPAAFPARADTRGSPHARQ